MPSLPDLSRRDRRPERMDQPDLDAEEHRRALRGLARIQRVRGTARLLWREVARCAAERPGEPVRLLDVACGGGDVAAAVAVRARGAGVRVEVAGCDRSGVAIAAARRRAERAGVEMDLFEVDVLRDRIPDGYDVIASGLFLHHLSEDEALRLLAGMRQAARRTIWIDDLARSLLGWLYAYVAGRLLSRSSTLHVDSLLSVRAAFTHQEAAVLAERAGLRGARLARRWPESWLLTWRRA
jgi:SAM-dependent methyltransferase